MTQDRHSRPETRLRLGSVLAERGRRLGLVNEDFIALEQTCRELHLKRWNRSPPACDLKVD
jgi:hypothetical protein